MKAGETTERAWFRWKRDGRVLMRLPGPAAELNGISCVPVQALQFPFGTGYIPSHDEVERYDLNFVRVT